jgi:hypothetical protein
MAKRGIMRIVLSAIEAYKVLKRTKGSVPCLICMDGRIKNRKLRKTLGVVELGCDTCGTTCRGRTILEAYRCIEDLALIIEEH